MAPTKKLSLEEKRRRLLDLFYETKEFFQLKELEKIASKQKGIVLQTVKEVLESLVHDNLVNAEKIGTSNYYWSFPSQGVQTRKRKIDELEAELAKLQQRKTDLEKSIAQAQTGREESAERTELLAKHAEEKAKKKEYVSELQKFRDCDPALLDAKKQAAKVARDAANRWTENVFMVQSFCSQKFNMTSADFNRNFSIPDSFDTIA